jgi:hypothetical protein
MLNRGEGEKGVGHYTLPFGLLIFYLLIAARTVLADWLARAHVRACDATARFLRPV